MTTIVLHWMLVREHCRRQVLPRVECNCAGGGALPAQLVEGVRHRVADEAVVALPPL